MSRLFSSKVWVVFAVSWLFCSCSDGYINLHVLGFDDSPGKEASEKVADAPAQNRVLNDAKGNESPADEPTFEKGSAGSLGGGETQDDRFGWDDGDLLWASGDEDFDLFDDEWSGVDGDEDFDLFDEAWADVDEDGSFELSENGDVDDDSEEFIDDVEVVGSNDGVEGDRAGIAGNGDPHSGEAKGSAAAVENALPRLGEPSEAIAAEFVPNLHRVSDDLYRSAYPREGGLAEIEALGVRSILELSYLDTDSALNEAQTTSLRLVHYPMLPVAIEQSQIVELFKIYEGLDKPVLVHCFHGADRTGLFVAIYRILYQNWTKDDAKDELVNGGYGYHEVFGDIIIAVDELDVEALRASVVGKLMNGDEFER